LIGQLLKEQNKYDQMPLSLLDQLKHVSHLAEKVADEIVSEETEILVEVMPRIFKVMQEIAKFLCEYVKRGRFSRLSLFWIYSADANGRRASRRRADLFEGQ